MGLAHVRAPLGIGLIPATYLLVYWMPRDAHLFLALILLMVLGVIAFNKALEAVAKRWGSDTERR